MYEHLGLGKVNTFSCYCFAEFYDERKKNDTKAKKKWKKFAKRPTHINANTDSYLQLGGKWDQKKNKKRKNDKQKIHSIYMHSYVCRELRVVYEYHHHKM